MCGDEVVKDGEEEAVGTVGADDEGGCGAGNVLRGDVDGDVAGVGRGMAGGDVEFGGVGGIGRAEGAGVAGDAGIELAVGGAHGEFNDRALGDGGLEGGIRCGEVRGAEDEVAVVGEGGVGAVEEFSGLNVAGGVGIAGGRCGARGCDGMRGGGGGLGWGGHCDQGDQGGDGEETIHSGSRARALLVNGLRSGL